MKIIGEYGLKNKREVWRVNYATAKNRTAARQLLTLVEKDEHSHSREEERTLSGTAASGVIKS